jgi:Tfp pilus assembly protein PilF
MMAEAQSLIDKGSIAEGTAILEDIVRREPHNTQAMMELAMVYTLDYKAPIKARQLLEKVVDINPNHRAALNELELLYGELGAQADGLAWLHLKTEQNPDALELQFAYGRLLAGTDPEGAIPWLVKATQIPDDREHAYNELAAAALKAGKVTMAIESWTKALQLAEADLEKAKAEGDTAVDLLEDRITVTRNSISDAKKQISAQ